MCFRRPGVGNPSSATPRAKPGPSPPAASFSNVDIAQDIANPDYLGARGVQISGTNTFVFGGANSDYGGCMITVV